MLGGGNGEEEGSHGSKAEFSGVREREQGSMKFDLGGGSDSSISSGVGSSLSTDPPTESIKSVTNRKYLGASNSSLSSASMPMLDVEKKERKRLRPQLSCRWVKHDQYRLNVGAEGFRLLVSCLMSQVDLMSLKKVCLEKLMKFLK